MLARRVLQRWGDIGEDEAARWKLGLIGLMRFWEVDLEAAAPDYVEENAIPLP